jgi:hypothetical protein
VKKVNSKSRRKLSVNLTKLDIIAKKAGFREILMLNIVEINDTGNLTKLNIGRIVKNSELWGC